MFLAHFVGDVHQPLHVGFQDDEGGNTIIIHWYRRKTNLHHVNNASNYEIILILNDNITYKHFKSSPPREN